MIRLQESLRALFYAPFYAALAADAYGQEGVAVEFVAAPSVGNAADSVMAGTADVCWGGPMRVMQTYQLHAGCDLVCFAEAVTRDPFILVGRRPAPGFQVSDLAGCRLATVAEVPTPWMCLQEDLRRAGIDPDSIVRVADQSMAENVTALRGGKVDVIQVCQPYAEELIASGEGHVWYEAANRGPCSYTTFYARRGLLAERHEELQRMVRALYRTQTWLAGVDGATLGARIAAFFPDLSPKLLAACCDRYLRLGIWGRTPVLPRAGYDRLRESLCSGGFVNPGTPFEVAVDNSLAEEAIGHGNHTSE
jgi:NitT/TauT family transport system substrate-binding protein